MPQKKVLILVSKDWYFLSHRLPLALGLVKDGYKVHVACHINQAKTELENHGFILHDLNLGREQISLQSTQSAIQNITKLYRDVKPDIVVHVALFTVLLGTIAALRAPVGTVINMITGMGYSFIAKNLKARLIRFMISIFMRLFSQTKRIHMIVQNGNDIELMQSFGFKTEKNLFLIRGSGVDAKYFSPSPELPQNGLITFVGRTLWSKGVSEIVEAARILKNKGKSYRIVLVGAPDPGNPQSATQHDIDIWQSDGLVECWGRRSDIANIYQQSSIALLPSWREGLPKSLLEAAACGLPMIATDVPGCREIVHHEKNGLLVPLKNPTALADAIENLMEHYDIRKQYGAYARKQIDTELNDKAIIEQTVSLINKLSAFE
ncbi:glycosyltransferase family 4 protein [Terasakiella sp. SH-1]|uniref:glycosyltransferase family 4 protein n=1 Tax=Terasakiella sp. SH-1 TaxID=2560057 RepID=UPI001073D546|nr:glycosyltransferase family 4 protein [Terasakiella sp. SH-1]